MSKLILYHGSSEIIHTPEYGKGKSYNDCGKGFYCTEHLELAKEWACTENTDGYASLPNRLGGFLDLNLKILCCHRTMQ